MLAYVYYIYIRRSIGASRDWDGLYNRAYKERAWPSYASKVLVTNNVHVYM